MLQLCTRTRAGTGTGIIRHCSHQSRAIPLVGPHLCVFTRQRGSRQVGSRQFCVMGSQTELPRGQAMLGSAEAWDHAADGYRKFADSVRSAAGLKAARLQAGETVLDVGTGPGMNPSPPPGLTPPAGLHQRQRLLRLPQSLFCDSAIATEA